MYYWISKDRWFWDEIRDYLGEKSAYMGHEEKWNTIHNLNLRVLAGKSELIQLLLN